MAGTEPERFAETTRGQVVSLLRRGPRTVDELARALGFTDNAVRAHLATLERDGLIRQAGTRRRAGAGKPATLFELRPETEERMSRAYAPLVSALVAEIDARMPGKRGAELLESAGRRLASGFLPSAGAGREARLEAGVEMLRALGGCAELESAAGSARILGFGCPLGAAVALDPAMCRVVEAMVREIVGTDVRQCCRLGERPSCCFEVSPAA